MANFWGDMAEAEYYSSKGVKNSKGYFETRHGRIFTQSWLPLEAKPKGIVCLTHGYGSDTGWLFQVIPIAMAQWEFATYAADMLGHGRSDGLQGLVQSFENVADAALSYFKSVRDSEENKLLPAFLFGESMGGAVTILMHLQEPKRWNGMILSAPMIVLGSAMQPSQHHVLAAKMCFGLLDTWPIFPARNSRPKIFRDLERGKVSLMNPRRYKLRPRVKTILEICRISNYLQAHLQNVTLPFLALHGTADEITDPKSSMSLHAKAASTDKTIKLYDGAYHSLLQAELKETREAVLLDMKEWLKEQLLKTMR